MFWIRGPQTFESARDVLNILALCGTRAGSGDPAGAHGRVGPRGHRGVSSDPALAPRGYRAGSGDPARVLRGVEPQTFDCAHF